MTDPLPKKGNPMHRDTAAPAALEDQPTLRPTRKWTAAAIAEVVVAAASFAALFGFDLANEAEAEALAGGVVAAVVIAGRVAAYFTRNRA